MANHKSAIKRLRQNEKIRARNAQARAACRTALKRTRAAIEAKDKTVASDLLLKTEKILATAANKRLYHVNNVSRKISRLAQQVAAL